MWFGPGKSVKVRKFRVLVATLTEKWRILQRRFIFFPDIRRKEQSWLHKISYARSMAISLSPTIPIISVIVTFLAHVSGGNNLTAAQVIFSHKIPQLFSPQSKISLHIYLFILQSKIIASLIRTPRNQKTPRCMFNKK